MRQSLTTVCLFAIALSVPVGISAEDSGILWRHLSSANGDMEVPNPGMQQTSCAVFDVDKDGDNDFIITERSEAPSVVLYRREKNGWTRFIVDDMKLRIEAGSAVYDIDGDGDLDVVFGGDGGSNQVWWWENPYPDYIPDKSWKRRLIKDSGKNKQHDQMFGDFDGDGITELVFWNQGGETLWISDIPNNPHSEMLWDIKPIYTWSSDSQMQQRGTYPGWKRTNEHEGLATTDIDGDGLIDIVGGGRWFKYLDDSRYQPNIIDASYSFSRSAAGQIIEGGRPEVVLVVGDGLAPLIVYEWRDGTWTPNIIIDEVDNGHTLDIIDFNGDGHLDIFLAEMNLGNNPDAKTWIIYGDGAGRFKVTTALQGFGLHESRIADLDVDGDYDILGKPYKWEAPRIDVWLNEGRK